MNFIKGSRVRVTVQGETKYGTVVYQRMAPPDYREAEAVSVYLEGTHAPTYVGSIFNAECVKPTE